MEMNRDVLECGGLCDLDYINSPHQQHHDDTAEDNHSEHPVNALNGGRGEQRQLT